MKKYYVAIVLMAVIGACSSNNNTENKSAKDSAPATPPVSTLSSNPDYQKGLDLIAKSDCLTCHKVSDKLTGPAYKDVAAKYESNDANIGMLASKIIKGGSGNWGSVPMTPHATLSEADAKQMVKYVLLLRNK